MMSVETIYLNSQGLCHGARVFFEPQGNALRLSESTFSSTGKRRATGGFMELGHFDLILSVPT